MIHRYEGVCIAKVVGLVEAETSEEARERVYTEPEKTEIISSVYHNIILLDDLGTVEEKDLKDGRVYD